MLIKPERWAHTPGADTCIQLPTAPQCDQCELALSLHTPAPTLPPLLTPTPSTVMQLHGMRVGCTVVPTTEGSVDEAEGGRGGREGGGRGGVGDDRGRSVAAAAAAVLGVRSYHRWQVSAPPVPDGVMARPHLGHTAPLHGEDPAVDGRVAQVALTLASMKWLSPLSFTCLCSFALQRAAESSGTDTIHYSSVRRTVSVRTEMPWTQFRNCTTTVPVRTAARPARGS